MTKFSENIIGKIKCDHIAPVPRWHFLMKGYIFWALFLLSILLGSLSFSVIMHMVRFGDLDMLGHLQGNVATSAVMLLPYFWILFLAVFAGIAYANWKCTKLGYRYKRRWIVLGSVVVSMFLGSVFHAFGMGQVVDNLMAKAMPFYDQSKHDARQELWLKPENGLLIGKITSVDEVNEEMIVQDDNGNSWNVADHAVTWENKALEKKGKIVKVVGKKDGEHGFAAKEIRRCNDCQDDEDKDFETENTINQKVDDLKDSINENEEAARNKDQIK